MEHALQSRRAPKTRSSRVKERPENYPSDATQMKEYCQNTAHARACCRQPSTVEDTMEQRLTGKRVPMKGYIKSGPARKRPNCRMDVEK